MSVFTKSRLMMIISLGIGCLLLMAVLVLGQYYWYGPAGESDSRVVIITPGSGTAAIARQLQDEGVIRQAGVFRVYAALSGKARNLKAGEYMFAPKLPLSRAVAKLATGEVVRHDFTIPEGFTVSQIAEKLSQAGLADQEAFLAVAEDASLTRAWQVPADRLEGFLFPDTYQFTRGMTARQIARRMVERFREKAGPELLVAGEAQGLNPLQLVTLASIIEREVKKPDERSLVASVFYNRLRSRKRLESCATVFYSQGRSSGDLSLEDLQTKSPYNTYRHRGLPPGPIGNPGLAALTAVAHPAQTDYLFFVVEEEGQHVFSSGFVAHKRAKWKLKRTRSQPKSVPTPPEP